MLMEWIHFLCARKGREDSQSRQSSRTVITYFSPKEYQFYFSPIFFLRRTLYSNTYIHTSYAKRLFINCHTYLRAQIVVDILSMANSSWDMKELEGTLIASYSKTSTPEQTTKNGIDIDRIIMVDMFDWPWETINCHVFHHLFLVQKTAIRTKKDKQPLSAN